MKAKRVSRKELKEKIKTLKRKVQVLQSEADEAREKAKALSDRLVRLGSSAWEQADITHIDVKPTPWGSYISLMDNTAIPDDTMSEIKRRLTGQLVRGLLEANMVQFIIRESDLPFAPQTIGAKLFVIPWEKTVIGRKNFEWRRFDPLDQGEQSGEGSDVQDREEADNERTTGG